MAACRLGSGLEGGVIVGVDDGEYASFAYKSSIGAEGLVQYIGMILSQDKLLFVRRQRSSRRPCLEGNMGR